MKKISALAILCSLLVMTLTGCSGGGDTVTPQQAGNFQPDVTANPAGTAAPTDVPTTDAPAFSLDEEEPLASVADATATPNPEMMAAVDTATATPEPTQAPTDSPEAEVTPTPEPTVPSVYAGYSYSALTDTAFGFLMDYPSNWRNLPGKYTACFEEQVADQDFPARIAVTSKKMAHKPESNTVVKQFKAYAQQIYRQYDPKTFEFGELKECKFMGKKGYAINYLAYSGDIEVKGYMCCCAIDYTIYVYHFCSSYEDYDPMTPVLTRVRDSVTVAK